LFFLSIESRRRFHQCRHSLSRNLRSRRNCFRHSHCSCLKTLLWCLKHSWKMSSVLLNLVVMKTF
jgi:hypothetical protein